MDKVRKTFDDWALSGRSELMEKEHSKTVLHYLNSLKFEKPFSFLDVGCGNGWVVRKMAEFENCKKATGIDKSKNMIKNALSKITSSKESYVQTEIEKWRCRGKFDFIFSMESLYYSESIEQALDKIYHLLKPQGKFACGTDFYKDNRATARWAKVMELNMHLLSKREWKEKFSNAGFSVRTKNVKDLKNKKKWKRDHGTLFIIGTKS